MFRTSLPNDALTLPQSLPLPQDAPAADHARILVVHDDAALAFLLSETLNRLGYSVVVAPNEEIATYVAELYAPDLLLLDAHLPHQAAFPLCVRFKTDPRTRLTPIIILSDSYDPAERLQAIEAGCDEYLSSIHSYDDLEARVRLLLWHKRQNDQLEDAEQVIAALLRAMAAKDAATAEHQERLADDALALGQRMGLAGRELAALRMGALLHDIGKLGVDEAILRKQGPLSEGEQAALQQHPLIGETIVQPLRLAEQVAPIVRHHHERWDGSGYPDGLAGEAIPLGARIVAVLDAFDAMTTQRPYSLACSTATALERLAEGAGSQWDPQVVAALAASQPAEPSLECTLELAVGAFA